MAEERAKLANMLRECASFVDRNEFHPHMYTVLANLHAYAGAHSDATKAIESSKMVQKNNSGGGGAMATHLSSLGKKIGKIALTATDKEKRAAALSSSKHNDRSKQESQRSGNGGSSVNGDEWSSWWAGGSESGSVHGGTSNASVATTAPTTKTQTAAVSTTTSNNQVRKVGTKPPFQRPTNPNTTLIANGWIEQLRRSKMTSKWKEVLASLVEGRNSGEETTLWIQREITSVVTGKPELEALHQIPIKWLEEIKYLDFHGENRFNIKVYNVPEEFLFRCSSEEAAQNWVLTLRSIKEIDERKRNGGSGGGGAPTAENVAQRAVPSSTSNMEVQPRESATRDVPTEESHNNSRAGSPTRIATVGSGSPPPTPGASTRMNGGDQPRMTISELRAIAHGLGVNTIGMERSDLERIAATRAAPQSGATDTKHQQELEAARRRQEADRQEELRRKTMEAEQDMEDLQQRQEEEKRRVAKEEQMRAAALAEERRRVEELRRQQAILLEEQRRQEAIRVVEEQRRREEELRRQEEARRAAHEAQVRYQQQQQAWQQQQAAQQAWQQQQAAAAQQRAQAAQHAQWQQWQQQQQQKQQQQQQQQKQQQPPFGGAQNPQQPAPPQAEETSSADLKYTKMAQEGDSSAGKINAVKRSILTHWALQPPQLSHLRQISDLLTTIHAVFPPAFGVAGHEYFSKWKPITREEIVPVGAGPDEEKLKKAVRKLRFFLHPDKLPRDLNAEQTFMCKMLWDVSSDSWEEYKKRHEELDWIKK